MSNFSMYDKNNAVSNMVPSHNMAYLTLSIIYLFKPLLYFYKHDKHNKQCL